MCRSSGVFPRTRTSIYVHVHGRKGLCGDARAHARGGVREAFISETSVTQLVRRLAACGESKR